jgi:hypothetical protein
MNCGFRVIIIVWMSRRRIYPKHIQWDIIVEIMWTIHYSKVSTSLIVGIFMINEH